MSYSMVTDGTFRQHSVLTVNLYTAIYRCSKQQWYLFDRFCLQVVNPDSQLIVDWKPKVLQRLKCR